MRKININISKKPFNIRKLKNYFNKNTFYGITAVGAVVIVVLYAFVYLDYSQRTETIQTSNAALTTQVSQLQEYSDNMALYQSQINDMKLEIADILEQYPAGAREEDVIMLASRMQESNQIGYSAINMDETEEIYSIPYEEVTSASIDGLESNLIFAGKRATYVVTTTYSDLKSVISEILQSDNRIGINDIVLAKNEDDGTLSGNIDLYFYSAVGTGKEYTAPDMASYKAGTDDIFKSTNKTSSSNGDESGEEGESELTDEEEKSQGQ